MKNRMWYLGLLLAVILIVFLVMISEQDTPAPDIQDAPVSAVQDTPAPAVQDTPNVQDESVLDSLVLDPRPDADSIDWTNSDEYWLFAWQLFLLLNQTVDGSHNLWETWSPSTTVYLECGVMPPPFGTQPIPPQDVLDNLPDDIDIDPMLYFDKFLNSRFQVDGQELLDSNDNPIRYEVRMNEFVYQDIVNWGFYNRDNQVDYFNSGSEFLNYDENAIEVKASWREMLPGEDTSEFYIQRAYYLDENGNPVFVTVGLTGFHIISKALPNWVWITFEQVENQETTHAPLVDPISPELEAYNDWVHEQLKGTVWEFYNLRGVQVDFTDEANEATILASTQIETAFQSSSSCISCHGLASIGALSDGRVGFFQFTPSGKFEGYAGLLEDNTYYTGDDEEILYDPLTRIFSDTNGTKRYRQLDYTWSLMEARSPLADPNCSQ